MNNDEVDPLKVFDNQLDRVSHSVPLPSGAVDDWSEDEAKFYTENTGTRSKAKQFESRRQEADVASKEAEVASKEQDVKLRRDYAKWACWFVLGWSAILVGLLLIEGWPWFHFHLSEKVMIVLITGVVANFITAFVIITKSLFPNNG